MKFVDANIFLRYLLGDDPTKLAACLAFFQRVQAGEEEATTCEAVIAEVVYVLSSRALFHLSPTDIRARLSPVLQLPGLRLATKRVYLRALDLRVIHPRLDFEDAVCIAHMERLGINDLLSYDRDFDRIPTITRQEPPAATIA